jgi:VanZ like family
MKAHGFCSCRPVAEKKTVDSMSSVPTAPDLPSQAEPGNKVQRRLRLAAAIVWTLVIMTLCWLPRTVVHEVEDGSRWLDIPYLDKIVHAGIFVVFSILWARVGTSRGRFKWVVLGGFLLAVVTEVGQLVPIVGRDAAVDDALTDFAGAALGLLVLPWVEPWLRSVESRLWRQPSTQALAAARGAESGQGSQSSS